MIGKAEIESLARSSARGGRSIRGFSMAGFLSKAELESLFAGAVRTKVIAGGVAGNLTVTGIRVGDALRSVLSLDIAQADHAVVVHGAGAAPVAHVTTDLTALGDHDNNPTYHAEHAAAAIVAAVANHGAVPHTRTWAVADLTAEFAITASDTINNAGGTNTAGRALLVVYEDLTP